MKRILVLLPFLMMVALLTGEDKKDYAALDAREFFQEGLAAFHSGQHNKAILLLEKSLQKKPTDLLTRYWLGWAMYYTGLEDTAVLEWRKVVDRARDREPDLEKALRTLDAAQAIYEELERQRLYRVENKLSVDVPLMQTLANAQASVLKAKAAVETLRVPIGQDTLAYWLDVLDSRRSLGPEILPEDRYLPLYEFKGKPDDPSKRSIFMRPTSIRPLENGGYVLASFGTEDVLEATANGRIYNRVMGTFGGFRGPFDALPMPGNQLLISEFTGDKISLVNSWGFTERTMGKKGKGPGDLLGPQYLAVDKEGSIYVTEWGNKRVSKFSGAGEFLLNFGTPSADGESQVFPGFKSPSGIAVSGDLVYVADQGKGQDQVPAIYAFDYSGNLAGVFAKGLLKEPEGLFADPRNPGRLLVCDRIAEPQGNRPGRSRVFYLNTQEDRLDPLDEQWDQGYRIPFASVDVNRQLLVADYDDQKIRVFTGASTVLGGMVIRPIRIAIDKYPEIFVEVSVEDLEGNTILGLETGNFQIKETGVPIEKFTLDVNPTTLKSLDVALVVDRAMAMDDPGNKEKTADAIKGLTDLQSRSGGLWIFAAGDEPQLLNTKTTGPLENARLAGETDNLSQAPQVDLALRRAAAQLIPGFKKRALVFITTGELSDKAFDRYSPQDVARYLKTNGIALEIYQVGTGPLSEDLAYICRFTGGQVYTPAQELSLILTDLQKQIEGPYIFKYTSITPSEAGMRYIPVEIESTYFKKSGRGLLGFFAPNDLIPPKGGFPPPAEPKKEGAKEAPAAE